MAGPPCTMVDVGFFPPGGGDSIKAYASSWSDACALMENGYKVVSIAYFPSDPEVVSIILEKK